MFEAFESDKAFSHIERLTSREKRGRQAGTLGDRAVQIYIAEQFEEYGLLPAGDLEGTSYFQRFEITTRIMSAAPTLEITGMESPDFIFREDFSPIRDISVESDQASGELVWIEDYDDLEFGDVLENTIVVRPDTSEIDNEIEKALEFGAVGIIFLGDKHGDEAYAKLPEILAYPPDAPFPVFELTRLGTWKLMELAGFSPQEFERIPSVTRLELSAELEFRLPPPVNLPTANVLGFLPGSDPYLKDEVIILGAHFDHVGDDPWNGLKYSGSNDDASGISGLLEIARIWHEYGYQPKRSVLFAAWGAQELEQAGSKFYVENPIYPLGDTVGVIQMDGIGGGDGFNPGIQADWETDGQLLFRIQSDDNPIQIPQVTTSDHFSFHDHPIPTLLMSWRLANEDNLPDNITNQVSPERLEICTRMTLLLLMGIAR